MKTKKILMVLVLIGVLCNVPQAAPTGNTAFHVSRMGFETLRHGITAYTLLADNSAPRKAWVSNVVDMNSFGIPVFTPAADADRPVLAAQGTVTISGYGKGTLTPIVVDKNLNIMQYKVEGVTRADHPDRLADKGFAKPALSPFDNMRFKSVGTLKSDCWGADCLIYATYQDAAGDMVVVELSGIRPKPDWQYLYAIRYYGVPRYKPSYLSAIKKWKFLYGTGKFEGITGNGDARVYTAAKGTPDTYSSLTTGPMATGSASCCIHLVGTYALK